MSHGMLRACDQFLVTPGVGAVRWRATEKGIRLERLAVEQRKRGGGVGSLLVRAVIRDAQKVHGTGQTVYLHAQTTAVPFYERLGFKIKGRKFRQSGVDHIIMQKRT